MNSVPPNKSIYYLSVHSVVVMLHVWYAIGFQFEPHLSDFFLLFWKLFH